MIFLSHSFKDFVFAAESELHKVCQHSVCMSQKLYGTLVLKISRYFPKLLSWLVVHFKPCGIVQNQVVLAAVQFSNRTLKIMRVWWIDCHVLRIQSVSYPKKSKLCMHSRPKVVLCLNDGQMYEKLGTT